VTLLNNFSRVRNLTYVRLITYKVRVGEGGWRQKARSGWLHKKIETRGKPIGGGRYTTENRFQLGFRFSFRVRSFDWSGRYRRRPGTQGTQDRAHGEVGQAARSVETGKTAGFLGYCRHVLEDTSHHTRPEADAYDATC
jgi:hypothetical protein